jgi:hypothetical protein
MVEKVGIVICYTVHTSMDLFVYRTINTNKKVKYKNFLHEVGKSWISEVQN